MINTAGRRPHQLGASATYITIRAIVTGRVAGRKSNTSAG